jgi:prenyltransferase beta subunit
MKSAALQHQLAKRLTSTMNALMNAAAMLQLKQQLSQISEKERQEVSAFIHRLKQESPAWQKEMSRRMAEMDTGKKFRLTKSPALA